MTSRLRLLLGLLLGSVLLSGCDFDVYKLPLPGGADVGEDPISVTVKFRDVLDLVPKSSVKVNDVTVGRVTDVSLDGYTANVVLLLRKDTLLPDDTVATIRQTSLLGEKFVSLAPPEGGGQGRLADGDVIDLDRTGRNPEVEEVLGALSLILNGGGVAQAQTITQELNQALTGREGNVKSVLAQIDTFTATLDDSKEDIVTALEALDRLSVSVTEQQASINATLDELPSALTSIDSQRQDLVAMLDALAQLSDTGVRVIRASKAATIESLRQLQPVLTQLADSGDDFVNAFNVFLTYPFVDEVVGRDPQVARNLHVGDYTNLSVTLEVDLTTGLPSVPGIPTAPCIELGQIPQAGPLPPLDQLCEGVIEQINQCLQQQTLEACQGLPQFLVNQVCQALPIPLPGLCPGANNNNGNNNPLPLPTAPITIPGIPSVPLPSVPLPPVTVPGLPLVGLGRAGTGTSDGAPWNDAAHGGPTIGQLQEAYDPALVSLLVPQLVTTKDGAQ